MKSLGKLSRTKGTKRPRKPGKKFVSVLGGMIRMRRIMLGLSTRELGKSLGFKDKESVISFESGRKVPCHRSLVMLADALSVNWYQLKEARDLDQLRRQPPKVRFALGCV